MTGAAFDREGETMADLLIKNAQLVDCDGRGRGDLLIRDGKIAAVGGEIAADCAVLDAQGMTVMPAFIDMHAHFRDPGYTYKEDIVTGSAAAAAGGYCAVNLMANTDPVCSHMDVVEKVLQKAADCGLVQVHQCVSVTENFDGETTSHLQELDGRVKLLSEDGKGVMKNAVMERAMRFAASRHMAVLSHAEDMDISPYDYRLAENIATAQHIVLAQHTGCHLHLCHVSTKEAIRYIIAAKKAGVDITCEVAPHHIWFADGGYRVNPPIRKQEDVDVLIGAIKDGWVDMIATDHAPHTDDDKQKGAPGMVGLETAFAVCYTKLCIQNKLPLERLSALLSRGPAELLGYDKGRLRPGFDGDVVLVDTDKNWVVDPAALHSKSHNTPFAGVELTGQVLATVRGGRVTYRR